MGWPPKGPEVVLLGAGARWLPQGCLKRARLKLPRCLKLRHLKLSGLKLARVFEAAAFDVAEDVCKFETDFNIVRR